MKKFATAIILIIFSQAVFSQDVGFRGMHGLYDSKNKLFIKYQSYSIYIDTYKGVLSNPKTINKIKKSLDVGDVLAEYSEPAFGTDNLVIEATQTDNERPEVKASTACYVFAKPEKEVLVILFSTINQRDVTVEHDIVKAYNETGLKEYISDNLTAEYIDFAGRDVKLGNACGWRGPNNLFCKGGQISWSEFPSYDQAVVDLQSCILANESEKRKVLSDEDIEVIFEDIPTIARRIVYHDPASQYPLAVYYIAQEVRERAVSCVMSNYVYNTKDYELTSLLRQFMYIPNLPEDAYNEFDLPVTDNRIIQDDTPAEKDYGILPFEVQLSAWQPVGNLRNTFKVAPSVAVYLGIPYHSWRFDLGFSFGHAINSKHFNYYNEGVEYSVKARELAGIKFRIRYQYDLARNLYFTPLAGIGIHYLGTNLKKDEYHEDESKYHGITTMDIFGGGNLRYKRVGVFAEYHYTPYSIGNKARSKFGSSALNIGVSVAF